MLRLSAKNLPPEWQEALGQIPTHTLPKPILLALIESEEEVPFQVSVDSPNHSSLSGDANDLLTRKEIARILKCSKAWLEVAAHRGYGPKFIHLAPKMVRYRRADLWEFIKKSGGTITQSQNRNSQLKEVR